MKQIKFTCMTIFILFLAAGVFAGGGAQSQAGPASGSGEIDNLRIGVISIPEHGDPTLNIGNSSTRVFYSVFDTLIYMDYKNNNKLEPMLAESWRWVDDSTLEMNLRRDVFFHNGDRFTSADVKFSFDRLKTNVPGIELSANLLNTIDRVDIVNEYTCRIITRGVDPILELRLASVWGAYILPRDYYLSVGDDGFRQRPVGTGPYRISDITPQRFLLERFEDYYGEKPPVRRVEFLTYSEVAPRITALATGELDIIGEIPFDQIATVRNMRGVRVEQVNMQILYGIVYNTSDRVLSDRLLRQALNISIDRNLLSRAFWNGDAIVPRGHQFQEFGDLYFSDYPAYEFNPQRARQLIAQSSYNGEVITYTPTVYTFANEVAEAVVDMWRSVGINAQVSFRAVDSESQVVTWNNSLRFADPAGGLWLLWGDSRGRGLGAIQSWDDVPAEFIAAGRELVNTSDRRRRAELSRRLMEIFDYEVPGSYLYQPIDAFGISDRINWMPTNFHAINLRAGNISLR